MQRKLKTAVFTAIFSLSGLAVGPAHAGIFGALDDLAGAASDAGANVPSSVYNTQNTIQNVQDATRQVAPIAQPQPMPTIPTPIQPVCPPGDVCTPTTPGVAPGSMQPPNYRDIRQPNRVNPPFLATKTADTAHTVSPAIFQQVRHEPNTFTAGTMLASQNLGQHVIYGHKRLAWNVPTLYAFLDPNCIFCHDLYEQLRPEINAGTIRLRVIMVGFVKPSSMGKAEDILASRAEHAEGAGANYESPMELSADEAGFNAATEEGGAHVFHNPRAKQAVEQHNALLQELAMDDNGGRMEVPTFLWKTPQGTMDVHFGMPKKGIIAYMQSIDQPALNRGRN